MQAAVLERYGPPEVFRIADIPEPAPAENEVLVRVHASIATPADCAFRSADPFIVRFFAGLLRPRTPVSGTGLAGEVVAVGPSETRFKPGDTVFGSSDMEAGAYARYVAVPKSGALALKPGSLSHAEAVGLAYGFLTAMPFLRDEARLQPGQRILINGASGSVGYVAVQIAKHMGADVTAVCSTRNVDLVRSFGADKVIDYTHEDFTKARGAYDVIFDAVGKSSFARCKPALKPGGIYLTTVPSFGILIAMLTTRNARGKRGKLATTGLRTAEEKVKDLHLMVDYVEAGALRPVIDRHYPLARIAEAHRYVETGHKVGDVIIDIGPDA